MHNVKVIETIPHTSYQSQEFLSHLGKKQCCFHNQQQQISLYPDPILRL